MFMSVTTALGTLNFDSAFASVIFIKTLLMSPRLTKLHKVK